VITIPGWLPFRRALVRVVVALAIGLAGRASRLPAQAPDPPQLAHVGLVTVVARRAEMPLALSLAEGAGAPADFPGLGRISPQPLTLIVVRGDSAWRVMSRGLAPPWGAAITLEGPRIVVLRADAGNWSQVLRHELAHLALHQVVHLPVPRWFDEGYASWAAGEWSRMDALTISGAVLRGHVTTLSALDGRLHDAGADPAVAYALAMSATVDLGRRNHGGTLGPLFGLLASGVDFDEAVLRTTGLSVTRFEEKWATDVRRRYGLFTWMLAGGGWTLVAVVVLVLARRRREEDAPRRAQLDEGWIIAEDAEGDELDPPPQT
jgi:hypothetical protein